MVIVISAGVAIILIIIALLPPPRRRPTVKRNGVEMMARNGRLVEFRETESEHEL